MARITDYRGSSYDRARRVQFLLDRDGDGTQAPCWECGTLVNASTIRVDRIVPGIKGGRYTRNNIRVHCETCSCLQGYAMGWGAFHSQQLALKLA